MIFGVFRDEHPRLTLNLTGAAGEFPVELIVDTGFAGDLSLPSHLAERLAGEYAGFSERRLANGQRFQCRVHEILLAWNDEMRPTEVLVLEGDPLIGTVLLRDHLLQMEMTDGGEISADAL